MAEGGEIHFCNSGKLHHPGCSHYAKGGLAHNEDPKVSLGHAGAHHGLMGMFKSVGHSKMQDPEKHKKVLNEARGHWERMKSPDVPMDDVRRTQGVRLAENLANGKHAEAADQMQGHPLMGSMGKTHLEPAMERLKGAMMEQEANPEALRSSMDYMHGVAKGHGAMVAHSKGMLGKQKNLEIEPEEALRETLKSHIEELQQDPSKLLDVGGNLGHYMPEHATELAAMLSTATEYLSSIKPQPVQMASLDAVIPPDKAAQAAYDRQLDIAEQPLLIFKHIKDGTLQPQDMHTVQTIYPGLYESMVSQAGEELIDAKAKNKEIPYSQKQTLSMLLGQPLDSTQTPAAMQAIIKSQGPQQMARQVQEQKKPGKATNVELNQINKTDEMAQLPNEKRQING